ncbi:mismatch repair ATPase MSH6 NDAI_0J01520 [Naumovozyma dairenensis CBS 421]|uniref:DNA mismatch repair protein n=1 Tax=Naumovozyma dairenensis (strain ATCC 10597 / BCRC 20456 / CBS 421 / NBRC 0211 / NRRL Y-12639) TaxID=1071378 RepID=G0WGW6_NAUDC|nr:hypothetical protein NDAI_0J01520 [Naumovozyma dairenensis CBS 421]CCD27044.1 hypothetical protein NDAI_0J01520 [Naumovozyma dairenensis CBS 421]
MPPRTPVSSRVASQPKDSQNSSQKKMKQSSVLSFFSKATTTASPTSNKNKILSQPSKSISAKALKSNQNKVPIKDEISIGDLDDDDDDMNSDNHTPVTIDVKDPLPSSKGPNRPTSSQSVHNVATMSTPQDLNITAMDTSIDDEPLTLIGSKRARQNKRNISYAEDSNDDDDDDDISLSTRKKKRILPKDEDSDNDAEFIPDKTVLEQLSSDNDDEPLNHDLENFESSDDDDILALSETKKKLKPSTSSSSSSFLMKKKPSFKIQPNKKRTVTPPTQSKSNKFNKTNEERYQWLVDERDAQRRPPTDPEYDPRSLYIPSAAWNKFTPFEKQYWEIKSTMWDCIVFFKKGKFFELYEKDALLANSLFDWKIAGGGRANMQLAGIPEMSFGYWASQFIQLGYKVAKVDQRESMLAKEMREGSKGIVKRELECVLTSGTLTDGDMLHSDLATFCFAIREEPKTFYKSNEVRIEEEDNDTIQGLPKRLFGVAFIDTATGELQMLEFEDDDECTKLDTIMSQVKPKEIIMEKNNLSSLANKIVKFNAAPHAIFNNIKPTTEFYDFERTYDELNAGNYFEDESKWPSILREYYDSGKKIGFSAFGGLLYYLKWLKLDQNLLTIGNIKEYNPIESQHSLILDGITLQNLEIFSNSFDGTDKGTLFKLFDRAITPMGKRMIKKWLMHPLLHRCDIEKRLDSVDSLMNDSSLRNFLESTFSKFPDLERMLARIHSGTIKLKDFVKVIEAFEEIVQLQESIKEYDLKGALSIYFQQIPNTLSKAVSEWTDAFDRMKAVEEDIIIPESGIEPDFDKSLSDIRQLENELQDLLQDYRRTFKCATIQYKDSGKEIYTIEVPVAATKRIPPNWVQMAANKSTKRYYSDEVRALARSMAEARELHKVLEDDLKSRLCKRFDVHYDTSWMATIQVLSNIDCLLSLTRTSESLGMPFCRPIFKDEVDSTMGTKLNGYLKFKSLRHPCFNLGTSNDKDFIPNDVELGKDEPQLGLLTGANAAGKSTVLRMTCVAVIMAQMGCYVPCEYAELTPVDRIMTRLGANDNIMQGKSTFFVELSETKKILDLATNRSLLVLDELGRGGSSSDGFAIAESVLHHVATHIQSLGFFATHYGTLGLGFKGHPQVRPMKMSILVDDDTRNVTFLYKLVDGQSEGSFGMHVASMCGIPKEIVDNAQDAADNLEHTSKLIKERKLLNDGLNGDIVTIPLGLQSDFVRLVHGDGLTNSKKGTGESVLNYDWNVKRNVLQTLFTFIDNLDD